MCGLSSLVALCKALEWKNEKTESEIGELHVGFICDLMYNTSALNYKRKHSLSYTAVCVWAIARVNTCQKEHNTFLQHWKANITRKDNHGDEPEKKTQSIMTGTRDAPQESGMIDTCIIPRHGRNVAPPAGHYSIWQTITWTTRRGEGIQQQTRQQVSRVIGIRSTVWTEALQLRNLEQRWVELEYCGWI